MAAANILPESLHPSLVRPGFIGIGKARTRVERSTPADYPSTVHGRWLPPIDISALEITIAKQKTRELADRGEIYERLAHAVGSVALVDRVGCWQPEKAVPADEYAGVLRMLAEEERQQIVLDTDDEFPLLRVCDNPECLYTRHYDFTYGTDSQRREKLGLNTSYFTELSDGTIQTAWRDTLPGLRESAGRLYDLQHRCAPFVPLNESALPPGSIAKITFNIETGCWEVRSYYNKPRGSVGKTMFDGYGRITLRAHIDSEGNRRKSMQMMGHRVIWLIMRGELQKNHDINHFCSNRQCCFDGHVEEVSHAFNVRHGRKVNAAKKAVDSGILVKTDQGFQHAKTDAV